MKSSADPDAPPLPKPRFAIGVTGHRASHPSFPHDPSELDAALGEVFATIEQAFRSANRGGEACDLRLLTLLADGTDHLAAERALARDWELFIPLPFGRQLNAAISSGATDPQTLQAILSDRPVEDPAIAAKLSSISALAERGSIFELADSDERITELLLNAINHHSDQSVQSAFAAEVSQRAALAGRILVEQSDVIVAVWDGWSTANIGGTGHTALVALECGSPVIWIDPRRPDDWQIVSSPEELLRVRTDVDRTKENARLEELVGQAAEFPHDGAEDTLSASSWRNRSTLTSHTFRRVEAIFGGTSVGERYRSIRQTYEHPASFAEGSGKPLLDALGSLTPGDERLTDRISEEVLQRFAWFDGISSHLSDRHRSGMILNFLLGACAIIVGVLYLPLVSAELKWIFAGLELLLLLTIVANTAIGRRLKLHSRWFETRRTAEYLRHRPILAALGVARPSGAWPEAAGSKWPEWYARQTARAVGLPEAKVDTQYLRTALEALCDHHVINQRDYHTSKAARLERVHHSLDRWSELLFAGAILVVGSFLALTAIAHLGWLDFGLVKATAKWFTVLAVALPTLGGSLAGIRYFGDFERFAENSKVTASEMSAVAARIDLILQAPMDAIAYDKVADIVRTTDQAVFDEIQNWQAVFSSKIMTIPA